MGTGAITQYVDVAQLVLYLFWIFFAGLIYYLVRENHREGYPMDAGEHRGTITGWPIPEPKTFLLPHGGEVSAPNDKGLSPVLNGEPTHHHSGAPLVPVGNPLLAGIGPGSWTERADVPDRTSHGSPKIVPLRVATDCNVSDRDIDPRGLPVLGADGEPAGKVVDMWLDVEEMLFRYIEVEVAGSGRRVLLPINFSRIKEDHVKVNAIHSHQFADVPGTKQPDVVTFLEEEKIVAYFGAGTLYADPARAEALL